MLFFFNVFINHFPKIHRSALRKITVDCCIFETFMAIIYEEKISGEVELILIHSEQMSLCKFIISRKRDSSTVVFLWLLLLKTQHIM